MCIHNNIDGEIDQLQLSIPVSSERDPTNSRITHIAQQSLAPTTSTEETPPQPKRFCNNTDCIDRLLSQLNTVNLDCHPETTVAYIFDTLKNNHSLINDFLLKTNESRLEIKKMLEAYIIKYICREKFSHLTTCLLNFLSKINQPALLTLTKTIIQEGHQPLFESIKPYITKNEPSATVLLQSFMKSPMMQITDEGYIEELCDYQDKNIEDLIDEGINDPASVNCSFISTLLVTNKSSVDLIYKTLNQLCKQGHSVKANWIFDLVQDHIKSLKNTPSALAEIASQLSFISSYLTWSTFFYQHTRFEDMDVNKLSSLLNQQTLKSIAESMHQDNLELIGATRNLEQAPKPTSQISSDTLIKRDIPIYLNQTPDFLNFIQTSHIHEAVNYYNHDWIVNKHNEPQLLVEGKLVSHTEILERFQLKNVYIGARLATIIVEKTTDNQFCYLENGLVQHNPTTTFIPIKKIEGDGKCYTTFISLDHGNSTTPAGIKRLFATHAWIQLQDKDGQIYSVGRWGSGQLYSPDLDQTSPHPKLIVKSKISEDQFASLIDHIQTLQQSAEPAFNLVTDNCACFSAHIASCLFQNPIDPLVPIQNLNTFENRIKFYNASLQITEYIFENRDKFMPVFTAIDTDIPLSDIIPMIRSIINHSHLDESTKSALNHFLSISIIASQGQNTLRDTPFYPLLKSIQRQILTNNQSEMTSCFFNLCTDLLQVLQPLQVNHPYTLWESLKKQPNTIAYQSRKI